LLFAGSGFTLTGAHSASVAAPMFLRAFVAHSGSISDPMNERPSATAATPVDPLPAN
jgi:hypothetical protein